MKYDKIAKSLKTTPIWVFVLIGVLIVAIVLLGYWIKFLDNTLNLFAEECKNQANQLTGDLDNVLKDIKCSNIGERRDYFSCTEDGWHICYPNDLTDTGFSLERYGVDLTMDFRNNDLTSDLTRMNSINRPIYCCESIGKTFDETQLNCV